MVQHLGSWCYHAQYNASSLQLLLTHDESVNKQENSSISYFMTITASAGGIGQHQGTQKLA